MNLMVWCAARGGMRSVVEAYERDGFLKAQDVRLVTSYDEGGFLKRQLILIRGLCSFIAHLMTNQVQAVHVHAAMRGSFWRKSLFASIARMFGKPVLFHLHGSQLQPFYESQSKFLQKCIRRQLEKAARVIVLSQSWKDFVGRVAPKARIAIVPNYVVIPPEDASVARRPHDILFLGFVGQRKGVFDLIPAFAPVAKAFPNARLLIGGNGQIDEARNLVHELGLDGRVVMLGWVSGNLKDQHLQQAGIYILPSYNEGLPVSVLEAMAAGLAVITTDVGGIPELITDRVDGLLVKPGDHAAITQALTDLLADDDFRMRVGSAGKRRVSEHYSKDVVLPMLASIYESP